MRLEPIDVLGVRGERERNCADRARRGGDAGCDGREVRVEVLHARRACAPSDLGRAKQEIEVLGNSMAAKQFRRGLQLREEFDAGAFHGLLLTLEAAATGTRAGAEERARGHFEQAVELSDGQLAAPYLSLAESVSVRNQDRAEFVALLEEAIEIDPDARPEWRLLNLVMQRRARWLLGRQDMLFAE